jgi:hypothetical protein
MGIPFAETYIKKIENITLGRPFGNSFSILFRRKRDKNGTENN